MYTIKDAATRICVSRSKLYQLVELRRIGHYRVGGKILFTGADLDAYLASCRVEKAEASPPKLPPTRVRLRHLSLD